MQLKNVMKSIAIVAVLGISCTARRLPPPNPLVFEPLLVDTVTLADQAYDPFTQKFYLPEWTALNKQSVPSGTKIVLGVSDPFVKPDTAMQQALFRAYWIASVLNKCTISRAKEMYAKVNDAGREAGNDTKFTRFQSISSTLTWNENQFQLIDSCTTAYGEKIILLLFFPDTTLTQGASNLTASVDVMQTEYGHRSRFEESKLYYLKLNVTDHQNNTELIYRLYKNDETSSIESSYNQKSIPFKPDIFKYLLSKKSQVPDYPVKTKLYYGLWKAFYESLLTQITFLPDSTGISVQSVSDNYGSLNQSLDQHKQNATRLQSTLHRMYISENELTLEIEKIIP